MTFITPETARTKSNPPIFGSLATFSDGRLSTLIELINNDGLDFRMNQKWNGILNQDNAYVPFGAIDPFNPPPYYEDPEGSDYYTSRMNADAVTACDLAIRWKVLGNPFDAMAVQRIVESWSNIGTIAQTGDARLIWSGKWPLFIQAARMIEDSPYGGTEFQSMVKAQTVRGMNYSTAYIQTENRAAWGLVLEISAASYLNDRPRMIRAMSRWRELFNQDVRNNILIGEIERDSNGLYYCNYWLNAMTQAAELARFNGEWLYDYSGPDGSTFKGVWETVAGWTAHPETYPYAVQSTVRIQAHVDPLHALWPNEDSQLLIDTYTTTQDFVGSRGGMLAYRLRPLYG